jgi:5'-deoxynucleotidase YfbR-like HD superfamily hydrolase
MIDRAHALSLALRHDIEEVITGDMPRQFKTQELTGELKRIIKEVAQANLEPEDYQMWREVQDGKSKEAQVVILADWLAGLRYMMIEARLGCKEILGNGIEFLQKDAKKIMKECPACKPFLKEINAIVEDLVNIYEHPLD